MYGVYKEKNLYGKVSMGIERATFLIDAESNLNAALAALATPEANP